MFVFDSEYIQEKTHKHTTSKDIMVRNDVTKLKIFTIIVNVSDHGVCLSRFLLCSTRIVHILETNAFNPLTACHVQHNSPTGKITKNHLFVFERGNFQKNDCHTLHLQGVPEKMSFGY